LGRLWAYAEPILEAGTGQKRTFCYGTTIWGRSRWLIGSDVGHFVFEGAGEFGGFVDFRGADLLHGQVLDGAEVGVPEVGAVDVGFGEVGAGEFGARQSGIDQVGVAEIGFHEVGFTEVGTPQVGTGQIGAAQVGADEVGSAEFLPGKVGAVQAFLIELCGSAIGLFLFGHLVPTPSTSTRVSASTHLA